MSDVVECPTCGARYRAADIAKVAATARAGPRCRRCGGALATASVATDGAHDHDRGEYDVAPTPPIRQKPTPAPARPPGRAFRVVEQPPMPPLPPGMSAPPAVIIEDAASRAAATSRRRKLIVGLAVGILPIAAAIFVVAYLFKPGTFTTVGPIAGGTGGTAAAAATPPPIPVVARASGQWPLPADAAPPVRADLAGKPIELRADPPAPAGVLFPSRERAQAIVVSQATHDYGARVDRYDLAAGTLAASSLMPKHTMGLGGAVDVSPDGTRLLVRSGHWLRVWNISGERAVSESDVEADAHEIQVPWAALLAEDRVIASYGGHSIGKLALLATTSAAPEGVERSRVDPKLAVQWSLDIFPTFTPRLSPGRKLVAYWADGGVRFADTTTGKLVASLPARPDRRGFGIAFDDSFKRAAVVWRDAFLSFLSVYDLTNGQTLAEFPFSTTSESPPRAWLDAERVMQDDGVVLDVKRGAAIWRYEGETGVLHAAPQPDARVWLLAPGGTPDAKSLAAVALPHAEAIAAASAITNPFVPTKGMSVAVVMNVAGPSDDAAGYQKRIQARVEGRLRGLAMVPVPSAPVTLNVSATVKDTKMARTITSLYGGKTGARVVLRNLQAMIQLTDGAGGPPVNLRGFQIRDQSKGGQSVKPGKTPADQLLDDQWAVLERDIDDFLVPTHLLPAAATRAGGYGHSKLQP